MIGRQAQRRRPSVKEVLVNWNPAVGARSRAGSDMNLEALWI